MITKQLTLAFQSIEQASFLEVLTGRRSRRFFRGANIPSGPFAFQSRHQPLPLTREETCLVLSAMSGITGWHNMIPHNDRYAPDLPNYSGAAAGRTFPSAAGFHTSALFFTNDEGVYFFDTKNADSACQMAQEKGNIEFWLNNHEKQIVKLSSTRLYLPPQDPHIESHNHWVANRPGSLFAIPVADLAEHQIACLCYYLQNGYCFYDDFNDCPIDGLETYQDLYSKDNLMPLSLLEHYTLQEATTELSIACYNGALMLQAMGLGGWMYNGVNPYSVLGASGDPEVPGLGFRFDTSPQWALPNPTGLEGVFEGHCPPHFRDMRSAVEAVAHRKFGQNGPFHPETPGPWKESDQVRGSAKRHNERFIACVSLQADYIYQRFGRFPGTLPTILAFTYLQAHHLDLDFYDHYFKPGSYLCAHVEHINQWHPDLKSNSPQ